MEKTPQSPRKGMPSPKLGEEELKRRYIEQFRDPGYDSLRTQIGEIAAVAWDAYREKRLAEMVELLRHFGLARPPVL